MGSGKRGKSRSVSTERLWVESQLSKNVTTYFTVPMVGEHQL